MADERVCVRNSLRAADTESTLAAVLALGAGVEQLDGELVIRGVGLHTPAEVTGGVLDVGNSGTLLRLLPGWLSGQPGGEWTLDGDESIRRRPVERVAEPLRLMGASIETSDGGLPPMKLRGRSAEHTPELQSPCNLVCRLLLEKKKSGSTPPASRSPSRTATSPPAASSPPPGLSSRSAAWRPSPPLAY